MNSQDEHLDTTKYPSLKIVWNAKRQANGHCKKQRKLRRNGGKRALIDSKSESEDKGIEYYNEFKAKWTSFYGHKGRGKSRRDS